MGRDFAWEDGKGLSDKAKQMSGEEHPRPRAVSTSSAGVASAPAGP